MKKCFLRVFPSWIMMLSLSGCTGERTTNVSLIYAATAAISFLLLLGCYGVIRKRDGWFLLLFSCIFVVNVGYLMLSVSSTLNEALWANRIAYLGSAFLPIAMLMIIIRACNLQYRKWLTRCLLCLGIAMFLIAASPGYLDIYYKEVSLCVTNGVATLAKEYGAWHWAYTIYLMGSFGAMLAVIACAFVKKKVFSIMHAVIMFVAVFVNLGVWLIGQLVKLDFEFLSVSYIISELFLLALRMMMQEWRVEKQQENPEVMIELPESEKAENESEPMQDAEQHRYFCEQIRTLTPTEHRIFTLYLSGKSTKEVLDELGIKENTLKFHNKNLYGKLGVSSRKQLLQIARTTQID